MPGPGAALLAFIKRYGPRVGLWLLNEIGLGPLLEQVQERLRRIGNRQNAIRRGREINGRIGACLIEDRARWVVYKDDEPVDIFPAIKGELRAAMEHYDLDRLRNPDELAMARWRRWAQARLHGLAGRLTRRERTAAEPAQDAEGITADEITAAEKNLGKQAFQEMLDQMEPLLNQLTSVPAKRVDEHDAIPAAPGVYLFSEGPTPIYVGQSRNLRRRLRQHTSPRSKENEAPLAFNIALSDAQKGGLELSGTRKQVAGDPAFDQLFREARKRVAAMAVRLVEIEDPITRTIFEVFASQALETGEFNSWETH